MTATVKLAILAVLLALSFWAGWEWRDRSADLKIMHRDLIEARAGNDALAKALNKERAKAEMLADIGRQYEQDKLAAKAAADAIVGDLRAGNLRLRREWQGCEARRMSDAAAGAIERDALAASRDALAGDLVRVGRDADDQLRACQAVVQADREAINGAAAQ